MNKILLFFIFMFGGTLLYSQNIVIDGVTFSADGKTLIKYPEDKMDEEYIVPEGTEVIGESAFEYSFRLRAITLPLSLNRIEDYAFFLCHNLSIVTWKHFPEFIGEQIFQKVNCLSDFNVLEDSDNCISIDGVLFSKDYKTLFRFPNNKNWLEETYEVPEGTEVIFTRAFENSVLYKSITLPSSLKLIGDEAFFINYRSTTNFSEKSESIEDYIKNIICNALTPPTVVNDPFFRHDAIELSVPKESFNVYRNTSYWKDFYSINGVRDGLGLSQTQNSTYSKVWIQDNILYLKSEKVIKRVEIYNINGACIWNECIDDETWQLETFKLPMDSLLIKVITAVGNQETFKLLNRNII